MGVPALCLFVMPTQESEPAVSFEAMRVNVESLPDEQVSETHTKSGGYEITAVGAEDQKRRTFHATALNINGMAISGDFSIAEHNETVTIEKDLPGDGNYANLILSK